MIVSGDTMQTFGKPFTEGLFSSMLRTMNSISLEPFLTANTSPIVISNTKIWKFVSQNYIAFESTKNGVHNRTILWIVIGMSLQCLLTSKVCEKERGGIYLAIKHVFANLWAQKVEFRHQKLTWMSEYSNPISSFILQNLNFFHFSWHIIWLVRRVVTIKNIACYDLVRIGLFHSSSLKFWYDFVLRAFAFIIYSLILKNHALHVFLWLSQCCFWWARQQ